MTKAEDLLREMCSGDPWCHSMEGLDDACHFCGSYDSPYDPETRTWSYIHEDECPWVLGRELLGLGVFCS